MKRPNELIASLGLIPHPEGGHFGEIFRSTCLVRPDDERAPRPALTSIYFLLARGDTSAWHRVASDEVWHFYEGDPIELTMLSPDFEEVRRLVLGPVGEESQPVRVVPANYWQSARSTGDYTLVGCTVGPGFDFADFALLRDLPADAEVLRSRHPEFVSFL